MDQEGFPNPAFVIVPLVAPQGIHVGRGAETTVVRSEHNDRVRVEIEPVQLCNKPPNSVVRGLDHGGHDNMPVKSTRRFGFVFRKELPLGLERGVNGKMGQIRAPGFFV